MVVFRKDVANRNAAHPGNIINGKDYPNVFTKQKKQWKSSHPGVIIIMENNVKSMTRYIVHSEKVSLILIWK